jgi:large subunit ribosomal protein L24
MKIKKGDKVQIITGKDKGKTGKVLQVFSTQKKASIEGLNLLIKHMRPKKQGEKGQRIEFPAAINISNLMLVCPKCNKPTRVNYKYSEIASNIDDSKKKKVKIRICQKCKETIK